MRHPRGFTLVELLVILSVIGIAAAMGVPALNNAVSRNKVFTSAEILSAQIREARLAAITRNRAFRVVFDCPGGAVRMLEVTGNPSIDNASDRCSMTQPNDGPTLYLPPNVGFGEAPPPVLEINGRGQISALGGAVMPQNISVSYASFTRTLAVTSTGRISSPSS